MVAEVLTGLSIFKSLLDSAKGLKDINDATVRNEAVIVLQEKILAAQAQQAELVERVIGLEKELADRRDWENEKQRFQLQTLPPGVHVYTLKEELGNGEPQHHICPTCFQRGKKSFLHQSESIRGVYRLKCNECGAALKVGQLQVPKVNNGRGGSWMS